MTPAPQSPRQPPDTPAQSHASEARITREIATVFLVALALVIALVLSAGAIPLLAQNLYALVAAVFVGIPYFWMRRRGADFARFGLTWDRWQLGVRWGLGCALLTLIPFAIGYWAWETQVRDRQMHLSLDHYFQWDYSLEGRPDGWGGQPGVWVWTRERRAHIGLRTGHAPLELSLAADRPFSIATSPGITTSQPTDQPRRRWSVTVDQPQTRAQITLGRRPSDPLPRSLAIDVASADHAPIRAGPQAAPQSGSLDIERGLSWILLWIATQLVFIAFPEEFFYRGYLQTRLGDLMRSRRRRRDQPEELGSIWGFTSPNLVASALFAAGHLFVPIGGVILGSRASVFFPSLIFGWLRDRQGTISGAVVYHAAANMMVLMVAPHFF